MRARLISPSRKCAPKKYGLFAFLLCAVLTGCTEVSTKSIPAQQLGKSAMAATTQDQDFDNAQIRPKLSAEELLFNLLELIRSSKAIEDFTQEKIRDVVGLDTRLYGPGHYGIRGQLTAEWNYALEVRLSYKYGPHINFGLGEVTPNSSPPMTDVCRLDFDRFSSELKSMGFLWEPYYVEHGRILYHGFYRHGMRLEIGTWGEANEPTEKIGHACIHTIIIK